MKIFISLFFLSLTIFNGFSQQNHFVYVQTDNKQPFYIKLNNKVYSSSTSGYAIVPKLQKADYLFIIGFPKNEWPLQNILVKVSEDGGYLLKNFGEKGWGFFNIQTLNVTMSNSQKVSVDVAVETLAAPPADSGPIVVSAPQELLKQKAVAAEEQKAPVAKATVKPVEPTVTTYVRDVRLMSTTKDKDLQTSYYVDLSSGKADTIIVSITIPNDYALPATSRASPDLVGTNKTLSNPTTDKKFLDIELENPNNRNESLKADETSSKTVLAQRAASQGVLPVQEKPLMQQEAANSTALMPLTINSDCKSLATDEDFYKARKKMAAVNTDEDMINVAKKLFRSKCYTTEQVRNLGLLFLEDAGKYNFYDAAYPFVNDTYNFSKLESQLSDPYYITRFKAMLRN